MSAKWKKFDGSEDQISEMMNAKDYGWIVKFKSGYESSVQYCDLQQSGFDINDIDHFMLCNPHPHAEMIIEWARTGREVYYWSDSYYKWKVDPTPTWLPDVKYSFNPDGDGNAK